MNLQKRKLKRQRKLTSIIFSLNQQSIAMKRSAAPYVQPTTQRRRMMVSESRKQLYRAANRALMDGEVERLQAKLDIAIEALEFYASIETDIDVWNKTKMRQSTKSPKRLL